MEPFYYNHMDKERQAVYRAMQQELLSLADSFQIPRIDGHALSDIFLSSALTTRRFSGCPALNTGISRIPRI